MGGRLDGALNATARWDLGASDSQAQISGNGPTQIGSTMVVSRGARLSTQNWRRLETGCFRQEIPMVVSYEGQVQLSIRDAAFHNRLRSDGLCAGHEFSQAKFGYNMRA